MSEILQDVRYGLRTLARSPGFTFVALATIAIGIGANAAIFSFVDGVLLKPSPFKEVDRMVQVLEKPPGGGRNGISALNYLDWERQNTVFEYLSPQRWGTVTVTGTETPVQIPCEQVGIHFFDVFQGKPRLGRSFAVGEDQVGHDHEAVISNSFWVSQYGSDPNILGRTITLSGEPYTVIGVMPPGRFDLTATKIWRPMVFDPATSSRDYHYFGAWGLLRRGVTIQQARAQMDALAIRISHDFPKSNKGWGVGIDAFSDVAVGSDLRKALYIMMGAVAMVLLIICVNLANLSLSRGLSREREVAIRAAIGASQSRLLRQFMTESLLLSAIGGALGVGVAYAGFGVLKATVPDGTIPPNMQVAMDGRVLLFILALSVVTGVLFGIVPALKATRGDLTGSIRQGGGGASAGHASKRLRGALVVSEIALAFILLAGAGLLIRSFLKARNVDTGFDSTDVVTANLPMAAHQFKTADEFRIYLRQLTDAVSAVPGVRDVAMTSALPLEGWDYGMWFQVVGQKEVDNSNRPSCFFKMIGPKYFKALGIHLLEGRMIDEHDSAGATPVTVISESMAKKYLPGVDPIGKQIRVAEIKFGVQQLGLEIPWQVVGVIADEKISGLKSSAADNPGMYVPTDQSPQLDQAIVIRGQTSSPLLQKSILSAVHAVNRDQVVDNMKTLDQIKVDSEQGDRFGSALMGIFAGIALLLAAIGLYGVISYSVSQRTREIGIRTALGANPGNIRALVLKSAAGLTAVGLAIGVAGALGLTRFLDSMLYDTGKYDPVTFVAVGAMLSSVAVLACLVPARRAMRVNPIVALRCD